MRDNGGLRLEFVIITGVSGAGKSQAMKALEDIDYYCMDNLPPALILDFVDLCTREKQNLEKVAAVVDIRGGIFFNDFFEGLNMLENKKVEYKIVFLDAEDEVLIKRYKEHRRPHPMSQDARIVDGIKRERTTLTQVKQRADYVIDTSNLTIGKFRTELYSKLDDISKDKLEISLVSFGFKNGILEDADLVLDVRFLPNPYYIEELRPLTGKDSRIKDYVFGFKETQYFIDKLMDMLDFLIPLYHKEGKSQLVLGIGCTGGKHRSVAIAEALKDILERKGEEAYVSHRDYKLE